jgi:hypothetical protein
MVLFVGENIKEVSGGGIATRSNLIRLKREFPNSEIITFDVPNNCFSITDRICSLLFGTSEPMKLVRMVLKSPIKVLWIDRSTFIWLAWIFPLARHTKWRVFLHNDEILYHRDLARLSGSKSAYARVLILRSYMWLCQLPVIELYSINPMDKQRYRKVEIWTPYFSKSMLEVATPSNTYEMPFYLIIGSLFPPNIEGIRWLYSNVSDRLNEHFLIVGKGMTPQSLDLKETSNFRIIGEVEDLKPYIDKSIATVAPIRYGSGLKIKIAESIFHGKHCLATKEAAEPFRAILKDDFEKYLTTFDSSKSLIEIIKKKQFPSDLEEGKYFG